MHILSDEERYKIPKNYLHSETEILITDTVTKLSNQLHYPLK